MYKTNQQTIDIDVQNIKDNLNNKVNHLNQDEIILPQDSLKNVKVFTVLFVKNLNTDFYYLVLVLLFIR